MSGINLNLMSKNLQELKSLAREVEASRKALNGLLIKVQELVSFTQKMNRHMSNTENRAYL